MTYYTDFTRLIIRGYGQPLYKRFNHKKMMSELKKIYVEQKSKLLAIFAVAINKISITSDIWTTGKHGFSYNCVTDHYINHDWIL
jgi:hypothetical protein